MAKTSEEAKKWRRASNAPNAGCGRGSEGWRGAGRAADMNTGRIAQQKAMKAMEAGVPESAASQALARSV